MELNIYTKNGDLKLAIAPDDSSRATTGIQEESILSLSFTGFECIPLEVYDYVDFEGARYWVTERYMPQMTARNEWAYSLQLHGVEGLAAQTLIVNTTDGDDNPVVTLTAPAREHAALIVANLNRRMNTTVWKVGEVVVSEYIHIEYTGKYASDALSEVAKAANTEWWFDGTTLNFSRCEFGAPIALAYGNGLIGGISRSVADGVKFFTRLFPVGSTRNIDPDKYGHARLQLPDGSTYVEQDTDLGIIEHYEQDAFEEIYPRRIGNVGAVRSAERIGENGTPFTIYYFTDPQIPFNPNDYEIGGLVKQVTFQSGELRGRTFEVNYDEAAKEFEIITQWPYDETMQLPTPPLVPATGDEYVLWNISLPETYYAAAEEEFLAAVEQYLAEARKDVSVFRATTDFTVIEKRQLDLRPGQRVRLHSEAYFPTDGYRDTRIVSVSRSINNPGEMEISMSDVLSTGRISRIEGDLGRVEQLTRTISSEMPDIIRSWEETPPSDSTIYSSRKSEREFLNKRTGGTIEAPIVVDDIRSSDFAGEAGFRLTKDENGDSMLVIDKIAVRKEARFNELVINQVSFTRGENIFTSGGFEIVRVEEPDGEDVYRCYYDTAGGRRLAGIKVGDQVRCQRYDAAFGAIVKYYWRLCTGVGADCIDLSKSDSDGEGIPEAGDSCVQFGSRTDKTRQAAVVLDPQNGGRIEIYQGIDAYTLSGRNMVGIGTDPTTGEAYMYGFGDFFVGDRDTEADDATYIAFRRMPGEAIRRVHIRGALRLAPGSSGLENLAEWKDKQEQLDSYSYLQKALKNDTDIDGGLIQSSLIRLGYTDEQSGKWVPKSGTSGIFDPARIGGGIAAWYGGDMIDMADYYTWNETALRWELKPGMTPPENIAQGVDRMDGTGYRAFGAFWWDASGKVYASPNSFLIGDAVAGNITTLFHLNYKAGTTDASDFGNVESFFALRPMTVLKVNSYIDLGEARLAWDAANRAIKISAADGSIDRISIYATGGIAALGDKDIPGGGGAGSGSGASALSELSDVLLTAPAADNVLVYDGERWRNRPMSAIKPDLSAYATQAWVESRGYLSATDLAGYATEAWVDGKEYATQTWVESRGYLSATDLAGYATEAWVDGKGYATGADLDARISALVAGAPAAFDTLKEIADVLQANVNSIGDIMTALGNKADKSALASYMTLDTAQTATALKTFAAGLQSYDASSDHAYKSLPFIVFQIPGVVFSRFVLNTDGVLHLMDGGATNIDGTHRRLVASAFSRPGGTAAQFLKADGSVDATVYWHAGNDGAGSGLDADLLDGVHLMGKSGNTGVMRSWKRGTYSNIDDYYGNGNVVVFDPKPDSAVSDDQGVVLSANTILLSLGDASMRNTQLVFPYDQDRILYRRKQDDSWNNWQTLAFLSSNVASASKLATARTLWGRPFDGTEDITGNLTDVGSIKSALGITRNPADVNTAVSQYAYWYGIGLGNAVSEVTLGGFYGIKIFTQRGMLAMTNAGRIGIGTTSPEYLLDVAGTARVQSLRIGDATISWDADNNALRIDKNIYSTNGVAALGVDL